MVEDDDARGARHVLDQLLDLGVVDGLELAGVEEVRDPGRVPDELEAVLVEREPAGERTAVADRDRPPLLRAGSAAMDVPRTERLVDRLLAGVDRIGELGGDRGVAADGLIHGERS